MGLVQKQTLGVGRSVHPQLGQIEGYVSQIVKVTSVPQRDQEKATDH